MRPPVVRTPRVTDTSAQGLSLAPRFTAWVALGGNLGDVAATFRHALADIAALPGTHLQGVSALYETEPWQAQGPLFLNAVAAVSTALAPGEFLRSLLAIEARLGRERPYLNAPRTLDLDLLAHGDAQSATLELTLPHPRAQERAFVLAPWAELSARLPDATLPPLPSREAIEALCQAQGARPGAPAGWEIARA